LAGHQGGRKKNLEADANTEANFLGRDRRRSQPMVQLHGGGPQDPNGDRLFVKKIKMGTVNWNA
jgi:hypothetical protein